MEGFLLEFKEMKDSINELKNEAWRTEIQSIKDSIELKEGESRNEIQILKDSINLLKGDLDVYKNENQILKDKIAAVNKEMTEIKRGNVMLQEQMDEPCDDSEKEETGDGTMSEGPVDEMVVGKSHKRQNVDKTVNDIKGELTKMQDYFIQLQKEHYKLDRLHRMLNILHVSVQSRKDLEKEIQVLKADVGDLKNCIQPHACKMENTSTTSTAVDTHHTINCQVLAPSSSKVKTHPSSTAVSREEVLNMIDSIKNAQSRVILDETCLAYNVAMWIGGYTTVETPCEFMDPDSGVYTVPVKGEYEFFVGTATGTMLFNIYLCANCHNNKLRTDVSKDRTKRGSISYKIENLALNANDKVWVEVSGLTKDSTKKLSKVTFRVQRIS